MGARQVPIHHSIPWLQTFCGNDIAFLKIDVQGFEKQVIAGGDSTVHDRCVGMQLELSFSRCTRVACFHPQALDLVDSLGYALGIATRFLDPRNGRAGRWHLLPGQRLTRRRVNLFRHSREDVCSRYL